jgi:hypothetical protein
MGYEVARERGIRMRKEKPVRQSADLFRGGLAPEFLAEFRGRIDRGIYDAPAMMHALAVRLLESGDV